MGVTADVVLSMRFSPAGEVWVGGSKEEVVE